MNAMNQLQVITRSFRKSFRNLAAWALGLGLFAAASASSVHAQTTFAWTNTAASGTWQDTQAWVSNGVNIGAIPGPADNALFTNRATYYVSLTNDATVKELLMQNVANSSATLTLDLGTNSLTLLETGTSAPVIPIELADAGSSTSILYIASSTAAGKGLFSTNTSNTGRVLLGRSGIGFMYVTNGLMVVMETRTGNGSSGRGTLTISGSSTCYSNRNTVVIANNASSKLNALIISNSASMTIGGKFDVGGQNLAANTNSLLLDSGGRLFTRAAATTIGNGAGAGNTATVQGGATWDGGNQDINIGSTGAGNSLTIGATSSVVNVSVLGINLGSTLSLTGGLLRVTGAITNASGTIKGFGTIVGNAFLTGTATLTPGFGTAVGTITFSNNLTLAAGSTTIVKLDKGQAGSNDFLNLNGTLAEAGTLTVNNVGADLVGGDTFKIFAFGGLSGSFNTTLPTLNAGLFWDTSQLNSQGIISVVLPPSIIGPTNQAVNVGATVTISTTVTGVPVPGVQWQLGGVNLTDGATGNGSTISGSTSNILTISNAQTNDTGTYCLIASNISSVVTNCMGLTVTLGNAPPSITGPTDQNGILNSNATFTASVAGIPTPTVQWQENGIDIPGATSSSVTITNVQFAQDGFVYSIIASNSEGTVTNSAVLHVVVPPAIATQPQNLAVTNTQSASFSVLSTNGVPSPTYQWYFNNGLISGATNDTYTITSATPANDGSYHVVVANVAGSVTSTDATLTVNSTMVAGLTPANNAANVCYDTPLYLAFDRAPVSTGTGKIKIFIATNNAPVDTIDTGLGTLQQRTIGTELFNTFPVIITGNTAAIYPHLGVLTSNQTYYVTVDGVTFADTNGAFYAGITSTNGWVFTTKPTGPANPNNVVVAADGSGDFCTVQGAVDSLPNGNTTYTLINIRNGNYTELVDTRNKNHMTFRGQDRSQTIVGYRNNDNQNGGTHARPAFKVFGDDTAIENLTITNKTPKGGSAAEALMLESNIKRFILYNAEVDSFQDTILGNTAATQAYFKNSLIQGDTDFIWGAMNAFFTNCEIRCLSVQSHVTQARTDLQNTPTTSNGMSFVNCQITRTSGSITNCDLGRTLAYPYGNVIFLNCRIDSHITGWLDVSTRDWEFGNSNLAATAAVSYNGIPLTNGDSNVDCAGNSTCWLYGWVPQLAPNILTNPVSQTVTAGVGASFSVVATGIPDPSYQWQKGGNNILNATNATFAIPSVVTDDAGTYSVIVSNVAGSVTSSNATLTVLGTAPSANFTATPNSGTEPLGVTFTDISTGSPNIYLSWDFGDASTSNTLGGATILHTYVAGTYNVTLTASNTFGTSTLLSNNCITVVTAFQAWQQLHFGCTLCPQAAASADPDGDGQNNLAEFLAGTDPNSAGSALNILSLAPAGQDVSVTWTTAGGRTNIVQATSGGVNGSYATNFTDLTGLIAISGSGDVTNNYLDVGGATNKPGRYYRVRLAP